jgi:hypothetical protein
MFHSGTFASGAFVVKQCLCGHGLSIIKRRKIEPFYVFPTGPTPLERISIRIAQLRSCRICKKPFFSST